MMGFFSQRCLRCDLSVLAPYVTDATTAWMNRAVVLTPDSTELHGFYDGYGRLTSEPRGEGTVTDGALGGKNSVYHEACWEAAGRPGYTLPSFSAYDQGYFIDPAIYSRASDPREVTT